MLKNKLYKAIPLCLIFILGVLALTGCNGSSVAKASKSVNNYKIVCAYDDNAKTVAGTYELSYINNTEVPLNQLKLHLYGNAYRENAKFTPVCGDHTAKAYPNGESYGDIKLSNIKLNGSSAVTAIEGQDQDILTVSFDKALYPTARYKINMDFTLTLADIRHRLGYNAKTVNLGNWYPIACVYENGEFNTDPYYSNGDCFYSDISNYEIVMTAGTDMVMASSGELEKAVSADGKCTYTVKAKAVRDFAIVLSNKFDILTAKAGKTTVSYYYYDEETPERSLQTAVDSVNTFNDMFGEYPYKTLAVVKTGFLHGGMEYPNLVYISDALDYDYYQEVIVHEVAHQWWYGVIGNNEVTDAWMDEGLADYSTTLFFERNESYKQTRTARIMETLASYLVYTDIVKTNLQNDKKLDTSMNRALNEYASEHEYVYMTYYKGQLMFDNLRSTIGDKNFFDGLKKYYSLNMFKNVKQEHMVGAFESASARDLGGWFNAWIKGTILITDLY